VQGLLEDITDLTKLPWIYPEFSNTMGGSNVSGSFAVPVVGSYINVRFPYDDIYSGFYGGNFHDPNTHLGMFNDDYPHSYGQRDEQNTYWKVNKQKQTAEFHHTSGAMMTFEQDATITLLSKKGMRFVSEDGRTELFFDMKSGAVSFAPKEGMTMSGPLTTINSNALSIDVGDSQEKVSGAKDQLVVGAYRKKIGGSYSQTVVGSVAKSCTGDYSKLVALNGDYTYGTGKKETIVLGDNEMKILVGDRSIKLLLGDYDCQMVLGDYSVNVVAGNIEIKTIAGTVQVGNIAGKLKIGIPGDVELSNLLSSLKMDVAGNVKIDATLQATIKALVKAELAGTAQTIVGSGSSITQVNGSIVLLGGGGLPVARLGDTVIGIGNLGIPVVSTIILGSFKVLAG
jgi:uncharacterized protein YaiE (UPF0345 family)